MLACDDDKDDKDAYQKDGDDVLVEFFTLRLNNEITVTVIKVSGDVFSKITFGQVWHIRAVELKKHNT